MRQTRRTDHERQREQNHVQRVGMVSGIFGKTQLGYNRIQLGQKRLAAGDVITEQTKRRDRVAGQLQRDEDRRNGIGHDQHDILRDLRIGHTFHAAENRIGKHHTCTDQKTAGVGDFKKAAKGHANAGHLADHIGGRCHDQTEHGHHAGGLGIEPVADELGHGELAELAQVRRKQQSQQNITAGPAHQEGRVVIAGKGNQARHRDERGRRHPVSRSGHAVGDGVNAATGGVEFTGRACARPDCDADVECERRAHKQQVECKLIHCACPCYSSPTPCSASSLFIRQA